MATGEFDLIGNYFSHKSVARDDVVQGIGDDCAILTVPAGKQLVVTTDTMVKDVHFLADADPGDIAHKLVAVNISDLAAMGAEPAWASLAITLPEVDTDWLAAFSQSLHQQLHRYGVSLIGGDTTKGPMTLTLTVQGFVTAGQALQRHGAQAGDLIYCTGSIGDAAAGLKLLISAPASVTLTSELEFLIGRHQRPTARVACGQALVGIASSCIDLSDGLASDLRHILVASSRRAGHSLAASIGLSQLPLSTALQNYITSAQWPQYALAGGDDYELLFTVPPAHQSELVTAMAAVELPYRLIGVVSAGPCCDIHYVNRADGEYIDSEQSTLVLQGWDHFQ